MGNSDHVIRHLQIIRTWAAVNPKYSRGLDKKECECVVKWIDDALELIESLQQRDDSQVIKSLQQENAFLKDMQKQLTAGMSDAEMGNMAMEALKRQGIIHGW